MGITSEEAKRLQFSGSEYAYDGTEVEAFRRRVIAALETYEALSEGVHHSPDESDEDLASAQRVRHQAVELAERMLRDVMGSSGDSAGGLAAWQDAAMLRALAQEEMEFATEEARRLPAIAAAERDEIRVQYAEERKEMRSELHNELQASRDAAMSEAEEIRSLSQDEANEIVKKAVERADQSQRNAADEVNRLQRRIVVLHTALADAESRFRRLASTAANEIGTLAAIADQDTTDDAAESARPDLHLASVDLTDESLGTPAEPEDSGTEAPEVDPEAGFYQKRLAGLRDRLEKSGHPPS
ncbi:MAG: hypothetical protein GY926_07655 [bacterium]|nr:hypothetical protein [bacterium]MCP4965096.1 hypothetical protein [bacterium]